MNELQGHIPSSRVWMWHFPGLSLIWKENSWQKFKKDFFVIFVFNSKDHYYLSFIWEMASKRLLSCCCWRSCWHTQKGQASNWLASLARILPFIPLNIIKSDYIQLLPSTEKFPWKVKKKWLLTVIKDFSFLCGPYVEKMIRGATLIQCVLFKYMPPHPTPVKGLWLLAKKTIIKINPNEWVQKQNCIFIFQSPTFFLCYFYHLMALTCKFHLIIIKK